MLARTPRTLKPETKAKPLRLNRAQRRHLVDTVAAILKTGDPTRFAFEATCRHAIRNHLCLAGWTWRDADAMAAAIVAAALDRVGARRPFWAEGQPDWVHHAPMIERTRCVRCHTKLPEGHMKFCSRLCATAHFMALDRIKRAEEMEAYDRVARRRDW